MLRFKGAQSFFTGLGFAALAFGAPQRMVVNADSLPLRANSSPDSRVLASLPRGESVSVEMIAYPGGERWCQVSRVKATPAIGWVECRRLTEAQAASAAPPVTPDTAVDEAFRLAGLGKNCELAADPATFVELARSGLAPEDISEFRALVTQMSRPETFERALKATLVENYSPELFPIVLEQLRSPLSLRMIKLLVDNARPDPKALTAFVEGLRTAPPSVSRVSLIRRVSSALGADSLAVDIGATIMRTAAYSMNEAAAPRKYATEDQIRDSVEAFRLKYAVSIADATVSQGLYIFRSASDQELQEYLALLESDALSWFNHTVTLGTLYGYQLVTLDLVPSALDSGLLELPRR